jgi:hypothetical protein
VRCCHSFRLWAADSALKRVRGDSLRFCLPSRKSESAETLCFFDRETGILAGCALPKSLLIFHSITSHLETTTGSAVHEPAGPHHFSAADRNRKPVLDVNKTMRKLMFFNLGEAYLCSDCEAVGNSPNRCPCCGSEALMALIRAIPQHRDSIRLIHEGTHCEPGYRSAFQNGTVAKSRL